MKKGFFLFFLTLIFINLPLYSQGLNSKSKEIYRWTDNGGTINYSSKKPYPDAEPANLPPILKERPGKQIVNLNVRQSCKTHGGISCEKGADKDGSVICIDGFKAAAERFQFRCQTAELMISDIKFPKNSDKLTVYVRNKKDIEATDIDLKLNIDKFKSLKGVGPKNIKPLSIAEYEFSNSKVKNKIERSEIKARLKMSCANCFE
jgi:hypothetical protein